MRVLILVLTTFFVTSSYASNESLYNAIAAVSGVANIMGGKSVAIIEDLNCQNSNRTEEVTCSFMNTNGDNVIGVSGKAVQILLDELAQAGAIAKKVQCLREGESSEGERLEALRYECHIELHLHDTE